MKNKIGLLAIASVIMVISLLSSCGQKGPLYVPKSALTYVSSN
ncbi:MAG: lipoprotein [Pseudomonadota bacterium]